MAKTENLTITCVRADIYAHAKNCVSVDLEDINILKVLDTIDTHDIIEWCERNLTAGDVFSAVELEAWAESNGYVRA